MVSIDEAYLDLTGCERLHGSAFRAADKLIRTVKERTGLNCSIGLSTSHLVSKIASDQAKPHGLLYVLPGCEAAFLAPLPIRRMPGIGKVTEPELRSHGITTIGDLRQMGEEKLRAQFGKFGEWLYTKSCGRDIDAYAYQEEPKSISHETTFDQDIDDLEELERTLSYLAQLVARRLRDHGLFAHTRGVETSLCALQNAHPRHHHRRADQPRFSDIRERAASLRSHLRNEEESPAGGSPRLEPRPQCIPAQFARKPAARETRQDSESR